MKGKARLLFGLAALLLYFQALVAWEGVGNRSCAVFFFSAEAPGQRLAEQILEEESSSEMPVEVCFCQDQGMQTVRDRDSGRQAQVWAAGLFGKTALYDWEAGALTYEETGACMIDEETAMTLFRSVQAEGRMVRLGKRDYTVKKVLPWKQPAILFQCRDSGAQYTSAFVHTGNGLGTEDAVGRLFGKYGLTGAALTGNPAKGLGTLSLLLLPGAVLFSLLQAARRERKACQDNIWRACGWTAAYMLALAAVLLLMVRHLEWPRDWIPGKWSDFAFWQQRLAQAARQYRLSFLLPKTAAMAETAMRSVKAAAMGFLSFLLWIISSPAFPRRERS